MHKGYVKSAKFALVALGIAVGTAGVARYAMADDAADAKDTFDKYYQAIQAKQMCEGPLDGATWDKITTYIGDQTKHQFTAGESATMIEHAKMAAGKVVRADGCSDRSVQQMISLYHSTEQAAQ